LENDNFHFEEAMGLWNKSYARLNDTCQCEITLKNKNKLCKLNQAAKKSMWQLYNFTGGGGWWSVFKRYFRHHFKIMLSYVEWLMNYG
jgi:hypothetical protein